MPRRRRRDQSQREASDFPNRRLLELVRVEDRPEAALVRSTASSFDTWFDVEDRRTWHPEGDDRPPVDFDAVPVRVVERVLRRPEGAASWTIRPAKGSRRGREGSRRGLFFPPALQVFEGRFPAREVVVCARRKERREVLFAKGRARGRVGKARRRDWRSDVSC